MTNKEHIQKLDAEIAFTKGEIKSLRQRYYEAKDPDKRFNIQNAIDAMEETNKTRESLKGLYKYQDSLLNGLTTLSA